MATLYALMAIDLPNLEIVVGLLREHQPKNVLAFGHPDILVPDDVLKERFGLDGDEGGAHVLFRQLGADLLTVDRRLGPGVDQQVDLNRSFPFSGFDMIVDSGTTEHVFNVGRVFAMVVKALEIGGIVYHCNPLAMFNHGYWNISPVAYHDFYTQNGFEILRLDMQRKTEFIPLEREERFRMQNDGKVMLVCVARKVRDVVGIDYPMQAKYQ